ncbi:MAG: hypothetical protein AAB304_06115, partial [Pseudomonadota bacterium]
MGASLAAQHISDACGIIDQLWCLGEQNNRIEEPQPKRALPANFGRGRITDHRLVQTIGDLGAIRS